MQSLPSFEGLNIPKGEDGKIDPVTELFRTTWPGVTTGPVVSQFLLSDFVIDSITVEPKAAPLKHGMDYMTAFQPWLDVQVSIRYLLLCLLFLLALHYNLLHLPIPNLSLTATSWGSHA